jgi:hypothetical protein
LVRVVTGKPLIRMPMPMKRTRIEVNVASPSIVDGGDMGVKHDTLKM